MKFLDFKEPLNFMRFKSPAIIISLLLVLGSLFSIFTKGINFGLDFTGGIVVEAGFEQQADLPKPATKVRSSVSVKVISRSLPVNKVLAAAKSSAVRKLRFTFKLGTSAVTAR